MVDFCRNELEFSCHDQEMRGLGEESDGGGIKGGVDREMERREGKETREGGRTIEQAFGHFNKLGMETQVRCTVHLL